MANILSTTQARPLGYPSQAMIDRDPSTGYLWALVRNTGGDWQILRSTDSGATWVSQSTLARANVQEWSGIFIDNVRYLHWCYRTNESSQDRIYYRRAYLGGTSPVWSSELLVANPGNGGVAGSIYTGMDMAVVRWAQGTYAIVVAAGSQQGANQGVTTFGVSIDAKGVIYLNNPIVGTRRAYTFPGTGRITPSVDLEHTLGGNGKGSSNPHIWISFGRTNLYLIKLACQGSLVGWSSPTSAQTIQTGLSAHNAIAGRWDGQRFNMCVVNPNDTDTVLVLQRNQANTLTTTLTTPPHPTGVVRNCALNYNSQNQDLRVFAVGTSTDDLYSVEYDRGTATWGTWALVLATDIKNVDQWGVRHGTYGNAKHDVTTAHADNTVLHTAQGLTYPPNTPEWDYNGIGYQNGAAANVNGILALDWIFSDPDPADVQSAYALSRQIGAGTLQYFRASDSTWQATEQKNLGSTTNRALSAGWASGSDAAHAYKVKVWDTSDAPSNYSDAFVVIPSVKVDPTITAPTAAQVITSDTVTISWTVSEQTQFRVKLLTNPGGVTLYDSGWVTSTATTFIPPYVLADLSGWTINLQTANNEGLASNVVTRNFSVDYLEPTTPTLVATPSTADGVIAVTITNPTPSGGRPPVSYNDLYRRETGDGTDGIRIAAGLPVSPTTYDDWSAIGGQPYEYRVMARGNNGTSIYGAWTA